MKLRQHVTLTLLAEAFISSDDQPSKPHRFQPEALPSTTVMDGPPRFEPVYAGRGAEA